MANYKAVANGNWSNLATWQDNSSGSFVASTVLPGAADVVYWNNFTVAIDQDVTVLQIRNNSTTGVTAGGTGTVSTSRTINADLFHATGSLITVSATSPSVVNINGNMPGTSATGNNFRAILLSGSATVNYTGNIIASTDSSAQTCRGIEITGSGSVLNVTGDVSVGLGPGYNNISQGTHGIYVSAPCTVNVVGNLSGPTRAAATFCFALAILNSGAVVSVTGNVNGIGGTTTLTQQNGGIHLSSVTGTLTTIGALIASNSSSAISGLTSNINVLHSGTIQNAANGFMAVVAPFFFNQSVTQWEFRKSNLTTNTLYTPGVATGHPATNNVRSGVVYGPTNNLTGTCAVPPANTVSLGVPVDNTVGTASLDANALAVALDAALTASLAPALTTSLDASLSASLPAAIAPLLWDEDVTNITTPNSIGERLKNCATVATTGAQISSFNP
jgi:hypothetical protein